MMKYETYDSSDGKAVLESGDEVSSATAQSLKEEQQGGDQLQMSVFELFRQSQGFFRRFFSPEGKVRVEVE